MAQPEKLDYGPKKFVVWLFAIASTMAFASLTSAYIVRKGEGRWLHFLLPQTFIYTTVIIVCSSLTLYMAQVAARKLQFGRERMFLWLTLILGLLFLGGQWIAWTQLVHDGIFFTGNPSGTFLYVISGLHGVHIVAGLCLVAAALGGVGKMLQARNLFRLSIASIFWHFLDILWIYLYVFLLLNQ